MSKVVVTTPDGRQITYRSARYLVTVMTRRGRGWRKVNTLASYAPGEWFWATSRSARQGRQPNRRTGTLLEALGEGTVPLADGVDLQLGHLVVILDALRSDGRHRVDLDDVKVVVSQQGWRLGQLAALSADVRRRAEPALYTEILKRCTTIK